MLTVEQVNKIYMEVVLGAPLSIPGDEAKRLRLKLIEEVAEMRGKGEGIAIPNEFPADDPVRPAKKTA